MADTPATQPPPAAPRRRVGPTLAVLALFAGLAVAQTWGYFDGWSATSRVRDWVVYQAALETTRVSVRDARELPGWDPWRCGGTPHLANPFVDGPSPWAALAVLLDVAPAVRLSVLGHLLAAMLGMWWWARRRQLDLVPALSAALAFGLSGFFVASISWGLTFLLPAAYLPLVLASYEAGRERWQGALPGAAALALMLLEGGLGVAQASLLLLGLLTLFDLRAALGSRPSSARAGSSRGASEPPASRWRQALPVLRSTLVLATGAVLLGAVKWWPAALYLRQAPLLPLQSDSLTLTQLVQIFIGRDLGHRAAGFRIERFEYFGYMGPLVLAAALWGLWRVREAELGRLFGLCGLWSLLVLGNQGPWMPYAWLDDVGSLRAMLNVPSRLAVALGAVLALVLGLMLQRLLGWLRGRWPGVPWQAVLALLPALLVVDQVWLAQRAWAVHPFAGDALPRSRGPFYQVEGDRLGQLAQQRQNHGTLSCHALQPVPSSPRLRKGAQAQAWLEAPAAGTLSVERQSPNRWLLDVELREPSRLLINQNAGAGWRAQGELPARATAVDGLLAVEAGPGKGRLTLSYHPPGLLPAAAISALAWLALLVLALHAWLARRRRANPY